MSQWTTSGVPSAVVRADLTRPADTVGYASGDLIGASTTIGAAGNVMALTLSKGEASPFNARRLRLKVNDPAFKAAIVRVHLFRDAPTVGVGDNGVLNNAETYAYTESNYLGYQDITLAQASSDGYAKGFTNVDVISTPSPGGNNIYALLECRSAVTPAASKTFTLTVEARRD